MPGSSGSSRAPETTSRGILGQPQEGHQVLHVGRLDELQPAVLVEGNVRAGPVRPPSSMLWCDARNSTACRRRSTPASRCFQNLADDVFGLVGFVLAVDQPRPLALARVGPEVLGVSLPGQADHVVGGLQGSAACCGSSARA